MTMTFRFNRLLKAGVLALVTGYAVPGLTAPVGQEEKAPVPAKPAEVSPQQEKAAKADKKGRLPLEELRTFTEVMQRIKTAYVEEVDDKTLLDNAIQGMLSGLDPHSAYLKPDDFKELEINTSGQFGGLGIEVGMEDGFIKVISPIDDTPADKAGIQAGDLIIKLDETSVKGMTLMESVDKMRGKPGEPIKLTIVREGRTKPLEINLKRAVIKVQSVKSRMLEDGYGYIRLSQFQADTDKEVLNHLKKLKKDTELKGLVLDLRNNPGGVLQSAVGVVDAFINKGLIVYTKGRIANSELRFNATDNDPSGGVPLVVLINGGSASASEIVAGALQDHHRAVLLGTESFGKGSVQTVLPLSIDSEKGLKLTTALYYTPSGRSIQAEGIKPDILINRARVTPVDAPTQYKEADLQGHLTNGNKDDKNRKAGKNAKGNKEENLAEQDYQLSQALNVLKGMHIATLKKEPAIRALASGDVKPAKEKATPAK
ncbi:MAG: S41 family peptidase [Endozoicomonas sp.]